MRIPNPTQIRCCKNKVCGKTFIYDVGNKKYCSKECSLRFRVRPDRKCLRTECHNIMPHANGKKKYCSKSCFRIVYYITHKEETKAYNKKWRKNNPSKVAKHKRDYTDNHRPRVRQVKNEWSMKERLNVLSAIGYTCIGENCPDRTKPVQVDHIQEEGYWSGAQHRHRVGRGNTVSHLARLLREGVDITKIVQPLCGSCNQTKHYRYWKDIK